MRSGRCLKVLDTLRSLTRFFHRFGYFTWTITFRLAHRIRFAKEYRLVVNSGLFDSAFYLEQNPDVRRTGIDPLLHYLAYGALEGRDPHPLFDSDWYLQQNPDLAAAGVNPLVDYLRRGREAGCSPHPLFDPTFYKSQHPDVAQAGVDPLLHYLASGALEGRDPHPLFDTDWYLRQNPELAASGVNPLVDYLRRGREPGCNPHPLFDTAFYLEQGTGATTERINPLVHYVTLGVRKRRNPNPLFDTSFYLVQYPDVAASGTNPLVHYATFGTSQWRLPNRWVGERWHLRNALTRLETAATSHVEANEFEAALRLIQAQVTEVLIRTLQRGWISGSDKLDGLCLSIGREVRGVADHGRPVPQSSRRRCVYVVSELYRDGGHTRLLEDLIAAQPQSDHYIIWTWGETADSNASLAEVIRVREPVPLKALHGKPIERLRAAFAFLTGFRPDVLVHLGHPHDPLAIALMQPGIARRRLMIHHSDCGFALGRSLEGTVHVALGIHFQDFARREWSLETTLLQLTCEEPVVSKAAGWARNRPFLTVTSGSSYKFGLNGELSYLDVLTERFAAREGLHVHIGSLSAAQILRLEQHLDSLGCRERFVYIEHVPDLASALHELAPSLYIDSYPIGGGRAIVEAMAAGLPICAASHNPSLDSSSSCYPERLWWTHPAQIGKILASLDPMTVQGHVALSRKYFERNHSPAIFIRHLQALIN